MRLRLAAAALMVAGIGVLAPAPASAVPNLLMVTGFSALDSVSEKSALATCPTGTRVLGGGGYILQGGRQVHFTRLQALGSSDQFTASAAENGLFTPNWRVYAYAICGAAPAGLEYVSFHTLTDSGDKTATATCTGSKKLISTGARVVNGGGEVIIDDMMLSSSLTTTTATAFEDQDGYAGDWSLYSYGVCADELPGLEFRSATAAVDSTDDLITATCPAGKKVHGLGAMMSAPTGEAHYTGLYPSVDLASATAISLEDIDGYANNWFTRVYAICAF